ALSPPPAYGTIGSAVPWNAITGSGGPSHGGKYSTPAIGAIAAMRSGMRQPSSDDIWPPLDIPVTSTRAMSRHKVASSWSRCSPVVPGAMAVMARQPEDGPDACAGTSGAGDDDELGAALGARSEVHATPRSAAATSIAAEARFMTQP